ncbi:MAG: AMP-binding protein [Serratia symbiotica]|nr:AMP-binding protein [Serratia symbiotica]
MQQPESATPCASLRQVFCSGEALSGDLARRFSQLLSAALHNLYGPTEAAVDVTWQPADEATLAQLTGPGRYRLANRFGTRSYVFSTAGCALFLPVCRGISGSAVYSLPWGT